MSAIQKRNLIGASAFVAGLAVLAIAWTTVAHSYSADSDTGDRIQLVAQCMSFRLAESLDDPKAPDNPVLRMRAGRTVEIVVRGADQGMKHDLAIPELALRTPLLDLGDTAVLRFTAPAPGTYEYLCTMHPRVMRGQIVVEP